MKQRDWLTYKADETSGGRPVKYGARAGETIAGNLGRDASGRFARVGGSLRADIERGTKKPKRAPKKKPAKLSPEELKKRAEDTLQTAGLSKSVYDTIWSADDEPVEYDGVKDDAEVQELLKQGLLENVDGMLTASAAGKRLISAAESGKVGKVKLVIARMRNEEKKRAERRQSKLDAIDERIAALRDRREAAKTDAAKKRIDVRIAAIQAKRDAVANKSKNRPTNPSLWQRAISEAKRRFDVYPSAYANAWAAKWYKKRGGAWSAKDLREWFREKWVDISKPIRENGRIVSFQPCGRADASGGAYPKCLPKAKAMRLSEAQRLKLINRKRRAGMPVDGAPTMTSSKHLPGKHDQSAHGRRGRVGGAFDTAYRAAREQGLSHSEARQEAKNAALIERQIIREEKQDLKRIAEEKKRNERATRDAQEQERVQREQEALAREQAVRDAAAVTPIEEATNIRAYTPDQIATYIEERFKRVDAEATRLTQEYIQAKTDMDAAQSALDKLNAVPMSDIASMTSAQAARHRQKINDAQTRLNDAQTRWEQASQAAATASISLADGTAHGEVFLDVLKKLEHPNPTRLNVTVDASISTASGATISQSVALMQAVYGMFPSGRGDGYLTLGYHPTRGVYNHAKLRVNTDGRGVRLRDVVVHETLHAIQFRYGANDAVNARAQQWAAGRIKGERKRKLRALTSDNRYGADEVAYRDKVDDPYTLKQYKRETRANGFLEVLTMAFTGLGSAHTRADKELLRVGVEMILAQG
jgi:hypothetical protein